MQAHVVHAIQQVLTKHDAAVTNTVRTVVVRPHARRRFRLIPGGPPMHACARFCSLQLYAVCSAVHAKRRLPLRPAGRFVMSSIGCPRRCRVRSGRGRSRSRCAAIGADYWLSVGGRQQRMGSVRRCTQQRLRSVQQCLQTAGYMHSKLRIRLRSTFGPERVISVLSGKRGRGQRWHRGTGAAAFRTRCRCSSRICTRESCLSPAPLPRWYQSVVA